MPDPLPPDSTHAVFTISASIVIDAPRNKVWRVMTDFPSFDQWNPFIRSATLTDRNRTHLASQHQHRPKYGHYLVMNVHIPPCLDANPSPLRCTRVTSFERITAVDSGSYRLAWTYPAVPSALMHAQRWQWLTAVVEDGDDDDAEEGNDEGEAGEDGEGASRGSGDDKEKRRWWPIRLTSQQKKDSGTSRAGETQEGRERETRGCGGKQRRGRGRERTRYDTSIAFYGTLSYACKWFLRRGLEEGFIAMTEALKARCEERS